MSENDTPVIRDAVLDPTAELGPAGLVATHRVVLPRGGYLSLVVRARLA